MSVVSWISGLRIGPRLLRRRGWNIGMPATEAFHLDAPTEEDLAVAEAAWESGEARYSMRTDDAW